MTKTPTDYQMVEEFEQKLVEFRTELDQMRTGRFQATVGLMIATECRQRAEMLEAHWACKVAAELEQRRIMNREAEAVLEAMLANANYQVEAIIVKEPPPIPVNDQDS